MNTYVKTALISLVACVLISALRDIKKEYAIYLALFCGICVTAISAADLRLIKDTLGELSQLSDFGASALKIFFKAVGITVISGVTSDACIDSGNRFLASCVELSCKIAVIASALPLINSVVKIIVSYIGI
ncbi:MAG: SpoIIIAC/SpoIIIAD family protein [Acutalibacteraceae bacterium]|nr:SpoIIIAC/SpoIIIAD family protein [Oscillospiraceae bacterium]